MKIENSFSIVGDPRDAKDKFLQFAKGCVLELDHQEAVRVGVPAWMPAGHIERISGIWSPVSGEKRFVDNLRIYLDKQAFIVQGMDYSYLVPYIIEHEIQEIWVLAKTGINLSKCPDKTQRVMMAHRIAVRREYKMALKDGVAEKCLDFAKKTFARMGMSGVETDKLLQYENDGYAFAKRNYK